MGKPTDYAAQLAQLADYCSCDDAGERLGCTRAWIKVLCQQGRLAARKVGQEWIIVRASVEAFARLPPLTPGPKPKKRRAAS
jgi:hypothetical protein